MRSEAGSLLFALDTHEWEVDPARCSACGTERLGPHEDPDRRFTYRHPCGVVTAYIPPCAKEPVSGVGTIDGLTVCAACGEVPDVTGKCRHGHRGAQALIRFCRSLAPK